MSNFPAGIAEAQYRIDTSQAEQAAARIRALWQGLAQDQQRFNTSGARGGGSASTFRTDEQAALRYASSLASVQKA